MRYAISLLTLLAALCLPLGWVLPLLELERLFFFTDTPSLTDLVVGLFGQGDWGLAAIIIAVSFVFPVAKLIAINLVLALPAHAVETTARLGRWLATFSKWSMIDVVLVALAIFAAKTSGLAAAVSQPGIWFFAISTIASSVAAGLVIRPRRNAGSTEL